LAAKSATSTIPIVLTMSSNPVKLGLTASYNRPGGNITGVNILSTSLEPKRLGLLHDLVPSASTIGFLVDSNFRFGVLAELTDFGSLVSAARRNGSDHETKHAHEQHETKRNAARNEFVHFPEQSAPQPSSNKKRNDCKASMCRDGNGDGADR